MSETKKETVDAGSEKMEPVTTLIRKLFPDRPFMVIVWEPNGPQRSFVALHTNCDLDECASLLKDSALHIEQNAAMGDPKLRHGNA